MVRTLLILLIVSPFSSKGQKDGLGQTFSDTSITKSIVIDNGVNSFNMTNNVIFQAYDTLGTTAITLSEVAIPLSYEDFKDSVYTHSTTTNNSRVYADETGVYKISYSVVWTKSATRVGVHSYAKKDGVKISRSDSYGYSRGADSIFEGSNTITFLESINSGSYIEIYSVIFDDNGFSATLVKNESGITIERIR